MQAWGRRFKTPLVPCKRVGLVAIKEGRKELGFTSLLTA